MRKTTCEPPKIKGYNTIFHLNVLERMKKEETLTRLKALFLLFHFEPNPKNPIIAAFFRNIGPADELGSGVRNLYTYGRRYSGRDPQLIDGDVFRIVVPLDDHYSFDTEIKKTKSSDTSIGESIGENETRRRIVEMMRQNPKVSAKAIAAEIGIALRNAKANIKILKQRGHIERVGSAKGGYRLVER